MPNQHTFSGRVTASNVNKVAKWHDFYPEPESFLDSKRFKAYVIAIMRFIEKKQPVTIRQIHKQLGYDLQAYTLDALERIDCDVSMTVPTKYTMRLYRAKDLRRRLLIRTRATSSII